MGIKVENCKLNFFVATFDSLQEGNCNKLKYSNLLIFASDYIHLCYFKLK